MKRTRNCVSSRIIGRVGGGGAQQFLGAPQPPFGIALRGDILHHAHQAARLLAAVEQRPGGDGIAAELLIVAAQLKFLAHLDAQREGGVDGAPHTRLVIAMHPLEHRLHARMHLRQVRRLTLEGREFKRVLGLVPAPRMHVRHVHREHQPAGAVLQRNLRQLLCLDILHRPVGAQRPPIQHLQMADHAHPDSFVLEGVDLHFHIEMSAGRLGHGAGGEKSLAGLRTAARQHGIPGDRELTGRGAVDAEHLIGPRQFPAVVAVFPTADLGDPLGLGQDVRQAFDLGDIDAAADGAHRIAGRVALDQAALQERLVPAAGIANPIVRGPSPSVDQAQGDGLLGARKVTRMNAFEPGVGGGFQLVGRHT
jgi:hypothetical protein